MKSKSKLIAASVLFTTVAGSALLASTSLSLAGLNDSSCWEQRQVTARDPIHARGCGSLGAIEPNNGERVKPAGVTLGKKLGGTKQNNPPPSPTPAASPPASPPTEQSPPSPPESPPPASPPPRHDHEHGNNGHGNDPDRYDNSNPGRKSGRDGSDNDGRPGSGHNNH